MTPFYMLESFIIQS